MTARPAPPSAMVERVHELLRDHFRDASDYESNDPPSVGDILRRADRRAALSVIAAVFDNLDREAMQQAIADAIDGRDDNLDEIAGDALDAAISAARAAALGTTGDI